jgi:hypothetical protein
VAGEDDSPSCSRRLYFREHLPFGHHQPPGAQRDLLARPGIAAAGRQRLFVSSSVALESNGNRVSNALGWAVGPSYTFSSLRWQPTLYYRYASFSGGGVSGNRDFDPLFYTMTEWGTWYQGDILGS